MQMSNVGFGGSGVNDDREVAIAMMTAETKKPS